MAATRVDATAPGDQGQCAGRAQGGPACRRRGLDAPPSAVLACYTRVVNHDQQVATRCDDTCFAGGGDDDFHVIANLQVDGKLEKTLLRPSNRHSPPPSELCEQTPLIACRNCRKSHLHTVARETPLEGARYSPRCQARLQRPTGSVQPAPLAWQAADATSCTAQSDGSDMG